MFKWFLLQELLDPPVFRAMEAEALPAPELDIFESDSSDSGHNSDEEDDERRPPSPEQPAAGRHLPRYTIIAVPNERLPDLQQSGIPHEILMNTLIFFSMWQLTFYWTTVLEEVAQLSPDGTLPNFWASAVNLPPDSLAEVIATRLARNTNEVK